MTAAATRLEALASASYDVLVVEDDATLARAVGRVLRSAGHRVTLASTGRHAQQLLAVRLFDAVVTDLNLPDMAGLDVLTCARRVDPTVSVLIMTGAPSVESAMTAINVGAVRYLLKPVASEPLLAAVGESGRMTTQRRAQKLGLHLPPRGPSDEISPESRLSSALSAMWMAYQPIYTAGGALHGYEALLRTDEPSLRNPVLFIDSAERLHRLHDLGLGVREHVARLLADAAPGPRVFVNLHPLDLLDDRLYRSDDPLARHANRVVLEMTERAALDDLPDVEGRVQALRDLGYHIAVDDLGAGYAGLTALARLSPEVVKIDMSLVRDVDQSTIKQKLVRMVTALAHELGSIVVAEGIETAAEQAVVRDLGCDLVQGYLLGKPGKRTQLVD